MPMGSQGFRTPKKQDLGEDYTPFYGRSKGKFFEGALLPRDRRSSERFGPYKKTPGTHTVFPAFRIIRRCLEREVDAGAGHSEVIIGSRDYVPADVVGPADVRSEANFKTTAHLADRFGVAAIELSPDDSQGLRWGEEEIVVAAATEDGATAKPEIRGKARAADREAQREGA